MYLSTQNYQRSVYVRGFKWKDIPVGKKYLLAFSLSILLFAIAGSIIFIQVNAAQNQAEALEHRGDRAIAITEMGSLLRKKDIRVADYINFEDASLVEEYKNLQDQFNQLETSIKPQMETNQQQELFSKIMKNDKKMNDLFLYSLVPSADQKLHEKAVSLRKQISDVRYQTVSQLQELKTLVNKKRAIAVSKTKENLQKSMMILLISIVTAGIIGFLFIYLVNRKIQNDLHNVVDVANDISTGNLSIEPLDATSRDEIGQLSTAINAMHANLRSLIENVVTATNSVSEQSRDLTEASNEVQKGSQQVASTMQELASGAEHQSHNASSLSHMTENFVQTIQQANQNGEDIALSSQEVLDMTIQGSHLMKSSVEQMTTIENIVEQSVEKVQGLDKQSQQISKLIDVIQDIAEQTNLLSLNASIEAARAGEHGKGFSVVANEVKKLSEQVSSSVFDITEIVQRIQKETGAVVESLETGYQQVNKGSSQIEKTEETFDSIQASVSTMADKMNQISQNLKTISGNSTSMNKSIENIASISEQASGGIQEAAASASQSNHSMEGISRSANELSNLSEELTEQVKQFRL